ncbi:uncharacterized protein RZ75_12230 [Apilactobacillus kunkeei]|uniref:Panacea domain-containing protein n=1 Tax=Apilactobacillus kunkeei TaxID=148814 RepID=UPI0006B25A64|nr:hypothetical protein [Apilactobacillus kunkeei]KOY78256.1 uncharacterized protein RZ75_12230 [Apilactobacillus kunkeei]
MKDLTMVDFAHHIIGLSHKNKLSITNLQLQKVMYFGLKYAIINKKFNEDFLNNMYNEKFLVWRYGPVEKSLYEHYRIYGPDPITESHDVNKELTVLDDKLIELIKKDPFDLVDKSHNEIFWKNNENKIDGWRSNVEYSLNEVAAEDD